MSVRESGKVKRSEGDEKVTKLLTALSFVTFLLFKDGIKLSNRNIKEIIDYILNCII